MPDLTLYISLLFADIAGLSIPGELTALKAWRDKVAEIPAVKNRSGQDILPSDPERRRLNGVPASETIGIHAPYPSVTANLDEANRGVMRECIALCYLENI
jgi:hypothetical protein